MATVMQNNRHKFIWSLIFIVATSIQVNLTASEVDSPPNIVVILTDDQRWDTLGVYDPNCPIETPNIDRLAIDGLRFENAFVTTPICAASRSAILSGRYSTNARHHRFETELPEDVFEDSYPMHLKRNGYFIGQLGKYGVGIRPDQKARFDVFAAQEWQGTAFREYNGEMIHDAEWLTIQTEKFLDKVPPGQAFCLQVNYKEPHSSSEPAPVDDDYLDAVNFPRKSTDTEEQFATLPKFVQTGFGRVVYNTEFNTQGDHNPYLRQYYEKIISVDRSVGEIMEMIESRGLSENTIFVFLSDHGTHFGENQLGGKWTPHDSSLRIPFIIMNPRSSSDLKGAVREEMVLNIDLAPTLLDLAGIKVPLTMDGVSLKPLILGQKPAWRKHFFFEHFTSPSPVKYIPRSVGVRTQSKKFVRWIDQVPYREEFYDLAADPEEANNLIDAPAHQSVITLLCRTYDAWREANPSSYDYDPYSRRPQALAPEIDWERFREVRPEVYEVIEKEVLRLGVSWEQAVHDWATRYAICSKVGYWY